MHWSRRTLVSLIVAVPWCAAVFLGAGGAAPAQAGEVHIAVAANFRTALDALVGEFRTRTGHDVTVSAGSTGLLHAQITQGAPFDVFLAADLDRPHDLIARHLAVNGSFLVYARGRLILLLAPGHSGEIDTLHEVKDLRRVAIANPRTAPYGKAALEVLSGLDLDLTGRLAFMQNASGVVSAVRSGAAEAGFAPRSALHDLAARAWHPVPGDLHEPIQQGAVLLKRAEGNVAAEAFLDYLASEDALSTMREFGYAVD